MFVSLGCVGGVLKKQGKASSRMLLYSSASAKLAWPVVGYMQHAFSCRCACISNCFSIN